MKGIVVTTDNAIEVKDFSQPSGSMTATWTTYYPGSITWRKRLKALLQQLKGGKT